MADNAEKLQQVKSMVRSVLLSVKEGVPAARLQRDYEDMVGEAIPFRKFGFSSFENFILGIPDVVRIDRRGGDVICHGVHDDSTAHIKKLVSKQRSKKVKKPVRRPRGGGSAKFINRPPARRPPLLQAPQTPRHYVPRHGIPSFISPPVDLKQRTPVMISIGNNRSNAGRVITVGNNALLNRAMSQINNQDRTPQRPPPPGSSRFEVPPRFRKGQSRSPPPPPTQPSVNQQSKRPHRPTTRKPELATLANSDQYITSLQEYMTMNNEILRFETTKTSNGYVSYVKVNKDTYGSEDIYKTGKEAEGAAARRAMLELKQDPSTESRLPPLDWNESASYNPIVNWADEVYYVETGNLSSEQIYKVKSRVKEILENKTNGLWNTRIPHLYKEKYNEEPPPDLLDLIKSWSDIARVEPNPSTSREIVYPVQEDPCMNLKIPKEQLLQYNDTVTVYMTFIFHPGYFFVQREDSCIDDITELLQRHCKTVGPPPPQHLEKGRYCAGIFSEDGQWTRAEILQTRSDGTVELLFVDYGNVEYVKTQDIRWLSPELAKYPYQAINCCLYGIQPLEGESDWSSASTKMFADMVLEEALIATPGEICDSIVEVQMSLKSDPSQSISDKLAIAKLVQVIGGVITDVNDDSLHPADLQLPEEKEWDVHVTYISTTLMSIMLRLVGEDYSDKLDGYQVTLEEAYRQCSSESPITEGVTYIAFDDDLFHRVRMISEKDGRVECYFLDHGDTDVLLPQQLRPIDPQINKLLPYQAVEVSLYGLEEVATNMTALQEMCELALGKSCVAEIVDREEIPSIILYDTSGEKDVNINDAILAKIASENEKNNNNDTTSGTISVSVNDSNTMLDTADNAGVEVRQQNGITNSESLDFNNINTRLGRTNLNSDQFDIVQVSSENIPRPSGDASQHSNSGLTLNVGIGAGQPSHDLVSSPTSRPILGRSSSSQEITLQTYKLPPVGEYLDVHVNFARDPSNFVCIPYDKMNELNDLLLNMLEYYSKANLPQLNKEDIKVGHYYAGVQDMVWYRVKVHSFVSTELVTVYQVDMGEYCAMMLEELRPLLKEFCELPALAFNATLGRIAPKSGNWYEAAKFKFIEMAREKDLIGYVLGYDTSGAVELRLIDTSNESYDVCVDEVLVKMGFAKSVE
ncbi:Tudor domain-containing protein 7 [Mactra antiquata]